MIGVFYLQSKTGLIAVVRAFSRRGTNLCFVSATLFLVIVVRLCGCKDEGLESCSGVYLHRSRCTVC